VLADGHHFLPSLRDLNRLVDAHPPLKRRAIVGRPCGTIDFVTTVNPAINGGVIFKDAGVSSFIIFHSAFAVHAGTLMLAGALQTPT